LLEGLRKTPSATEVLPTLLLAPALASSQLLVR